MKKKYLIILLVVFLVGCSKSKEFDCTNAESTSRIENNYKNAFSSFYFNSISISMDELKRVEERISNIDDITNEHQRRSEEVYTSGVLETHGKNAISSARMLNLFNKGSIVFKVENIREANRNNNKVQCNANLNIYLNQKFVGAKPIKYELEKLLDSSEYYMNSTAPDLGDIRGLYQIMISEMNIDAPVDVELVVLEYLKQKE